MRKPLAEAEQQALARFKSSLQSLLGDNLLSLRLFGSRVRGEGTAGKRFFMTEEGCRQKALSLARLKRSKQHLKSTRDLLPNDDFADSVSRSYYAISQAARALL